MRANVAANVCGFMWFIFFKSEKLNLMCIVGFNRLNVYSLLKREI